MGTNKPGRKSRLPTRGLILSYHREKGPLGGTLAIFFIAFLELFQIFQKQNIYEPNFATPIFFRTFFWVRFVKGVQIFEPVGKKLLGRHALGGDFGGLFL